MRNIAIADRRDWVSAPPRTPAPRRSSRLRDWLATLPIILLVPALIIPYAITSAAQPSLRFSPGTGEPGARITVDGGAFDAREAGQLVWAADGSILTDFQANPAGKFKLKVRVPSSLAAGTHDLTAVNEAGDVRASVAFKVTDPTKAPEPTATPKPTPEPTATPKPTPEPTATPKPTPEPTATPKPTATPAPTAAPTANPTPTPQPTASPTPSATPAPAHAGGGAILMSSADISKLPTSGAAWNALKSRADGSAAFPNLSNQDDNTDLVVLAKGLVYARTGTTSYRTAAYQALKAAVGTEAGGRTLALGRNLPGYVLAADLIGLSSLDPTFDTNVFRPWLRSLLTANLDGMTLRSTHELRPNNWGTHAGAARAAIAAYLGDSTEMARTATVFRGWLGDRSAYIGFKWGDLSWQCDSAKPVGINPAGCSKDGIVIDGALPEEMRRGGTFQWPPAPTGYAWEGLQGAVLQAELLRRAGYDAWNWSDRALLRSVRFLYDRAGWPAVGDDEWQPWLIDRRHATGYRTTAPASTGKNFGYTDWLYTP